MPHNPMPFRLIRLFLPAVAACCSAVAVESADEIDLNCRVNPDRVTSLTYQLSIQGELSTPAADGNAEWDLMSTGRFQFFQRQFAAANAGPTGFRAIRQFDEAAATTTVGKDHRTTVQLPASHRTLRVFGSESALTHVSPDVRLSRKHVDLLQLPCDPIAVNALLPTRLLKDASEKWNSDPWVVPMLIGLDGVISQQISCEAVRVTDREAVIQFSGSAEGAVSGAAVNADISGRLTLDRAQAIIREFRATLKEKRTPGVVSPGLDITAEIRWTQSVADDAPALPEEMPAALPEPSQLLLTLATPWRLKLLHHRDWHVFHETAELVMLRLLHHGALIGQCNISPSLTVPAGSFTSEETYAADVQSALTSRGGRVTKSTVSTAESGWRMHHVRATSSVASKLPDAESETVYWDYYLCTWTSGEQFSIVFTHTASDDAAFGDSAQEILNSLVIRQNPPKLILPR